MFRIDIAIFAKYSEIQIRKLRNYHSLLKNTYFYKYNINKHYIAYGDKAFGEKATKSYNL